MTEHWFESAGVRLFAVEHGTGTPIILVHGGLATHLAALHFAAPLAQQFRLITPDLRASGRSHFAGPLSWNQLADDVAALVRHLDIERAVIGGASLGAGVAVATALRHPQLVERLVLLAPAFAGADVGLDPAQSAAMRAMDAAGSRAPAEGMQVMLPLCETLPVELRERVRAMFLSYDPASVAASTAFMASGAQPFERAADLARITAPVLVVPGMDPQHPPAVAEQFARHLPRATVRTATPSEYAQVIAAFMTTG
jgi:3-oxoadipate enol-lactonase